MDESQKFERLSRLSFNERVNFIETDILDNQLLVVAKLINPTMILFEFRMLSNFEKVFEKECIYDRSFDAIDHGFEKIKTLCEIKKISFFAGFEADLQISLDVIDNQLINNY